MEDEEKILDPTANIIINIDSYKWATIGLVKRMLEVNQHENYEELGETFAQHYESRLHAHAHENLTSVMKRWAAAGHGKAGPHIRDTCLSHSDWPRSHAQHI